MAKKNYHKNGNKRKTDIIERLYQEKINDLKKKSITSKENKELYKQEYEQTKRHIKEMREMALKKEIRDNTLVTVILVAILIVFLFIGIGSIRYSMNAKKENANVAVVNTENEVNGSADSSSDDTEKDDSDKSDNQVNENDKDNVSETTSFSDKIYKYLAPEVNRQKILELSISQNNNKNTGMNLIFLSNILKENGIELSKNIVNNAEFKEELKKNGFKTYTNPNELQKGDIVFTIDVKDSPGVPSHVYIFMGWVDDTKKVANVVDGQVSIYKKTYHTRNVTEQTPTTDKMQFFMRKE